VTLRLPATRWDVYECPVLLALYDVKNRTRFELGHIASLPAGQRE
jgi:hypothetical protein